MERTLVNLTEHLYVYADDPLKILYKDGEELKWLKYMKNEFAANNLNEDEKEKFKAHRKLMNSIETTPNLFPKDVVLEELKKIFPLPESETQSPAVANTTEKPKVAVVKGSEMQLAKIAGLPEEMADMFFMKLDGKAYITVAGLQFLAGKIGFSRIETEDHYDKDSDLWVANVRIVPRITPQMVESISKLAPQVQEMIITDFLKGTNATGTAGKSNVRNTKMYPFLREMAQTRALGRALRKYVSYGGTSYEEMPEASIGVD